jgi:proteasome lid subunit RPN8/RPN11
MRGKQPRQRPWPLDIKNLEAVCHEVVYPHVFRNSDREVGGVLVGGVGKEGGTVVVLAAIEAIAAEERRATLTFTQESWAHVHRVMEEHYPDDKIVGWYHSHPSFGIFLSHHDLFIHQNFFTSPSQFAFVVDPIARREGVFMWTEGEITGVPAWERDVDWQEPARASDGSMAPLRPPRPISQHQAPEPPPSPPLISKAVIVVGVVGFAAAFAGGYLYTTHSTNDEKTPPQRTASANDHVRFPTIW